ncbi:nuclear transport factor 2 family protein [Agaribacter flavus]|uniref:Nuclear transport factor 2 family protein n=1 Tax=Agaribacter flavus TaxID=1902781 RepID=A0ABV7FQB3_9ALTE
MSISAIKSVMQNLMNSAASNFDHDALDKIYHDDMRILMIDANGNVNHSDKPNFMATFKSMHDQGIEVNTWAEYNDISVDGDNAHVLITRKNKLAGYDALLVLSIDFVFESERWQITREVIFVRPDTGDYPGEDNKASFMSDAD